MVPGSDADPGSSLRRSSPPGRALPSVRIHGRVRASDKPTSARFAARSFDESTQPFGLPTRGQSTRAARTEPPRTEARRLRAPCRPKRALPLVKGRCCELRCCELRCCGAAPSPPEVSPLATLKQLWHPETSMTRAEEPSAPDDHPTLTQATEVPLEPEPPLPPEKQHVAPTRPPEESKYKTLELRSFEVDDVDDRVTKFRRCSTSTALADSCLRTVRSRR